MFWTQIPNMQFLLSVKGAGNTVTVSCVKKGSVAEKKGILPGDIIISINQNEISDVLDYRFYITEKKLSLLIHRGPELITVNISKGEYDDIGLEFESFLMDQKHSCTNKCIFCFIDQLPSGMRDTLYFKDDDSRLSFLMGNYITLTNMKDSDIDRIIKMHMSPINISVHTTDPELRCKMLNNRFAGEKLKYIERLARAGITVNCQIVLCKGVNDGDSLTKTICDLAKLHPGVSSVAIVPAGLTRHRQGLYELSQFTEEESLAVIEQVEGLGESFIEKFGERFCFCSDEFFLLANEDIPDEDYYEGYPQLDNGVGLITSLKTEFYDELAYIEEDYDTKKSLSFSIATGESAYPLICQLTEALCGKCPSLSGKVYKIQNDFFGHTITVAGLVCGCDIISQLEGKELGEVLFIPSVMLRAEGDMFLDDITLEQLQERLGVKVIPVNVSGQDFIARIMNYQS